MCRRPSLFVVLLLLLGAGPIPGALPARADTIDVFPGPLALTNAINGASAGDVLNVHLGTYNEAVDVNKSLHVRGELGPAGEVPTIDATCSAAVALRVSADGVKIDRFFVRNATYAVVDVQGVDKVRLAGIATWPGCGSEEYGVNVYQATRVKLLSLSAFAENQINPGFLDAGIYIGAIPAFGKVKLTKAYVGFNPVGILVEDSAPGSVIVRKTQIEYNDTGILLRNSDGVKVLRNNVGSNADSGIEVDASSDDNVIGANLIGGSTLDVIDNGTSNCWKKNVFTTGSVPSGGC